MCEEMVIIIDEIARGNPALGRLDLAPPVVRPAPSSKLSRRAPPELHTTIFSECMPWFVNIKHRIQKHGHMNIQEAYAYRSLLQCAPGASWLVVLQVPLANICVEMKGRAGSPALSRVV